MRSRYETRGDRVIFGGMFTENVTCMLTCWPRTGKVKNDGYSRRIPTAPRPERRHGHGDWGPFPNMNVAFTLADGGGSGVAFRVLNRPNFFWYVFLT